MMAARNVGGGLVRLRQNGSVASRHWSDRRTPEQGICKLHLLAPGQLLGKGDAFLELRANRVYSSYV